eukprot:TRINITY_DN16786_c0_g1_i6.p1 TRINITY_DN16786_c0_g1~~TRINITY_DN16786_c0_g1_i6.p1  ORF type:complete len:131 (-),score=21.45 TRINITY_DN16786_c0_g1_i6:204-596(-)
MGMIPLAEPLATVHDDHVGPSGLKIVRLARLDRRHLRRPECIAVRKEPILPEQVGNDAAVEGVHIELRMADRDGRAAEQPCLELMAGRAIATLVVEQRQPCLLLAFRSKGQVTDGVHVDMTAAIESADAR